MERVAGFFSKTPEITKSLATLIDNENFKESLEKAGSIGALISLGIGLYEHLKNDFKTKDELAFASLIKIASESAQESLADNNKIEIKSAKSKEATKQLFNTFIKTEGWNSYLPDHPVIVQFRSLICDILRYEQQNNVLRDFVFNFNITLEEKADKDPDIEPFKKRITHTENTRNLIKHLEYSRTLIYKANPIDQKTLDEYYVENNALLVDDVKIWGYDDSYFSSSDKYASKEDKSSSFVSTFLKRGKWYTVVGAPFGIGKTSLSIYLTSTFASKYLEDPNNDEYNYIPIFVPLKGKLDNIDDDQNSLDDILKKIAPGEEGKKRKILLFCDGLDEYGDDESKLIETLKKKREELENIKVIITTRLEAGIPQKLDISSYIRLLPFNENQVNQFFKWYGLSSVNFDRLKNYNLKEEEICKPLFCWMFAIMNHPKSRYKEEPEDNKTIFKDIEDPSITRSLLYQGFIHSIIRGKHQDIADKYHWSQYYTEEKRILRKIAALRQMHCPNVLTKSMVIEGLKNYGIVYDEKSLKDVLEPILTSYFYLQSKSSLDLSIDFIHKSFGEYLLAEYYIESILVDGEKVHYLSIGVPTLETVEFLDALLELLNTENENVKEHVNILIKSLVIESKQELSQSIIKTTLIEHAQRFYENEQIIFQTESFQQQNKIWNIVKFPASKYHELWIHRWLLLFVLNKLGPEKISNKKILEGLIHETSHTTPGYLKRMAKLDLSGANLSGADLSGADLLGTNLSSANLSGANLLYANLSSADLTDATLSSATLTGAALLYATLSSATLTGATLSRADLFGATLTYANLSFANLLESDLRNANLSSSDLSSADLTDADLTGATLTSANLTNTILPDTHKKNYGTTDQSVKRPFKRITKYTSDGKPIMNEEENHESA